MADYHQAIELIIKHEGYEYVDHPSDSGGATKFGITLQTLRAYRGIDASKEDVKNLELDEAIEIYRKLYWEQMRLSQISAQIVADVICDQGVLWGPLTAVKRVQIVLGRLNKPVRIDGVMGTNTINAINSVDPMVFALEFIIESGDCLINEATRDKKNLVFIRGWTRRIHDLIRHVLELKADA